MKLTECVASRCFRLDFDSAQSSILRLILNTPLSPQYSVLRLLGLSGVVVYVRKD